MDLPVIVLTVLPQVLSFIFIALTTICTHISMFLLICFRFLSLSRPWV
jgi:hypothetical protein